MSLSPEECAGILNLKAAAGFKRQATRQRKGAAAAPRRADRQTRVGRPGDWRIDKSVDQ